MSDPTVNLRPVQEPDLHLFERMESDPEIAGPLSWSGFVSPVQIRRRFQDDGYLGPDSGRLVVTAGEEVAGFVSWIKVFHGPPPTRSWNMGIGLLPEFRGRGIGTVAQRLLADYLFRVTDVVRLEAGTLTDNVAEQRSLEKAGFQREGVLRSAQFINGGWHDVVLFSRLRGD